MNQQKIQDQDINKFICEIHNECQLQFLYFGETPKLKSRMLCGRCMIGVFNAQERQPALLFLKDFLNNPANQLMKITQIDGNLNKGNEGEIIEEIEKLLQKFEIIVNKQLESIRQNLTQLKTQLGVIATEINDQFKLNNIIDQFKLLGQMDSYQGSNELAQLEENLNNISVNLNKAYISAQEKVKDNQTLIVDNFSNNFKIIQNEYEQVSKQSLDLIQNLTRVGMPTILYEDLGQFPQIHELITQGKNIQYQLLYQGTRDGLNGQSYWAKCNNQSNLLTIMTSKNGYRFGAFSPCQLNSALCNYIQDPTMKSFLFQYNKKEIYKIKNQAHAVYCHPSYGPCFGQSCDVSINADFVNGSCSCMGQTYDISAYNIADKANHIFGSSTPQLQECKVYKIKIQLYLIQCIHNSQEISVLFNQKDVVKQLELVAQIDNYQETNEYIQLEEQLNNVSNNLNENYLKAKNKVKDNQTQIVNYYQNNFKAIKNEFEYVQLSVLGIFIKNSQGYCMRILTNFLRFIQRLHEENKFNMNYYTKELEIRESQAYWHKCRGQANLLTIMTSKNGNRLRGYSPCYVNRAINAFVEDKTKKSFCSNTIIKKFTKYETSAINNMDQFIGSSDLGNVYDVSRYKIVNVTKHLYGESQQQLNECKVYKVLF